MTTTLPPDALARFAADGFLAISSPHVSERLRAEVEGAIATSRPIGGTVANFAYAPMMTSRTPISLALLGALAEPAEVLLGRPALPIRAKGQRYSGSTTWHADSASDLATIGFLAYFDVPDGQPALRVVPGSHAGWAARVGSRPSGRGPERDVFLGAGELLVIDEHLLHASGLLGGRLQWRVDFLGAPRTDPERDAARALFGRLFDPTWDGGYDPDRFPSYDAAWRGAERAWTGSLAELGAYALAEAQEEAMRERRRVEGRGRSP